MLKLTTITLIVLMAVSQLLLAQSPEKDAVKFIKKKNEFMSKINSENKKFEKNGKKAFIMDFDGMDLPKSKDEFTTYWHNDPVTQGNSGMCWCFSTTSFYESEIYRIKGEKIKLSELYTVYWEYVEKARRFVQKMGASQFSQGSMGNHIPMIWEKYGVVPAKDYTGLKDGQPFHNHSNLFKEMKSYLNHVKENKIWDEAVVLKTIKYILNSFLEEPPTSIIVNGDKMTPLEYFKDVLEIDFNDYIDVLSILDQPNNEYVLYDVSDNWWRSKHYYNVQLDTFMTVIKNAVRNGYTLAIGGDVSEPGYYSGTEVAMVPTFDIPSEYIDENARLLRFRNGSTTDDHGIHIVGYQEREGVDWFLIKDSGSGSRNGPNEGYYFYHEDYIKLKIMDFAIHKDAIKGFIDLK